MNRRRLIDIGKNITLFPKILPGVGLREIVLLGLAALQAVYFAFYVNQLALGVRLTLALLFAIPIVIVTSVPFHGMTFERWLWQQLAGVFEPKRYRHTTADPRHTRLPEEGVSTAEMPDTANEPMPQKMAGVINTAYALDAPNLGVIMALFACLLVLASTLAYATRAP